MNQYQKLVIVGVIGSFGIAQAVDTNTQQTTAEMNTNSSGGTRGLTGNGSYNKSGALGGGTSGSTGTGEYTGANITPPATPSQKWPTTKTKK